MRFALRNKSRLSESFGADFCESLVCSLKRYFESIQDIPRYKIDGYPHEFITVPGNSCSYQFAIVREMYDVLTLAYYPARNSN